MNAVRAPAPWLGLALFCCALEAQAYALTGIYDFRAALAPGYAYPAQVHEFEGLAFHDGSLWASNAANPAGAPKGLWKLDLQTPTDSMFYPHGGSITVTLPFFGPTQVPLSLAGNPVGLASDGTSLLVGNNLHALGLGNPIWAFDPASLNWGLKFPLSASTCDEVEGLAFSGGKLYTSCQDDRKVLELNPATGSVERTFTFTEALLGLAETDDGRLIVGTYAGSVNGGHELRIFDPDTPGVIESISLSDLFVGTGSDYYALTGQGYSVQVVPAEGFRTIPTPDGLAYGNGKIYMSFDGDLRIFEISPDNPSGPGLSNVPEPASLALLGLGLAGLGVVRRRRS